MGAHVFRQRAIDRRGIRAEAALERLFAGVFAQVPGQRPLLATGVGTELAFEGLLARVDADVFCQVAFRRRGVRAKRTCERLLLWEKGGGKERRN